MVKTPPPLCKSPSQLCHMLLVNKPMVDKSTTPWSALDSGGPIWSGKTTADSFLRGVVSWGHGCAAPCWSAM